MSATLSRSNVTFAVTSGTVVKLSDHGIPAGCESVLLQCDSGTFRYTQDGTNPAAGVGLRLVKDLAAISINGQLANVRFIAEGATGNVNAMFQMEQSA